MFQGKLVDLWGPALVWMNENRARYESSRRRYPSDLTDKESALIAPHSPPARRDGNERTVKLYARPQPILAGKTAI